MQRTCSPWMMDCTSSVEKVATDCCAMTQRRIAETVCRSAALITVCAKETFKCKEISLFREQRYSERSMTTDTNTAVRWATFWNNSLRRSWWTQKAITDPEPIKNKMIIQSRAYLHRTQSNRRWTCEFTALGSVDPEHCSRQYCSRLLAYWCLRVALFGHK